MAKLSAHGIEAGRIVYTTSTKAYMSDGKVLKNRGDGWKRFSTVKANWTPESALESSRAALARWEAANPAGLAYKRELHAIAPQGKRAKLHTIIQLMPDDADGVWSARLRKPERTSLQKKRCPRNLIPCNTHARAIPCGHVSNLT